MSSLFPSTPLFRSSDEAELSAETDDKQNGLFSDVLDSEFGLDDETPIPASSESEDEESDSPAGSPFQLPLVVRPAADEDAPRHQPLVPGSAVAPMDAETGESLVPHGAAPDFFALAPGMHDAPQHGPGDSELSSTELPNVAGLATETPPELVEGVASRAAETGETLTPTGSGETDAAEAALPNMPSLNVEPEALESQHAEFSEADQVQPLPAPPFDDVEGTIAPSEAKSTAQTQPAATRSDGDPDQPGAAPLVRVADVAPIASGEARLAPTAARQAEPTPVVLAPSFTRAEVIDGSRAESLRAIVERVANVSARTFATDAPPPPDPELRASTQASTPAAADDRLGTWTADLEAVPASWLTGRRSDQTKAPPPSGKPGSTSPDASNRSNGDLAPALPSPQADREVAAAPAAQDEAMMDDAVTSPSASTATETSAPPRIEHPLAAEHRAQATAAQREAASANGAHVPLPNRIGATQWAKLLDRVGAGRRVIEVSLGDGDGSLRIQAERGADGLNVNVRFSDPELHALAGAHAAQLRETLTTELATPIRLSLDSEGNPDTNASGQRDSSDRRTERGSATQSDTGSRTTDEQRATPNRAAGRREWVG